MTTTAIAPPTTWAHTKAGSEVGAIPANVLENIRPMVMAGLAKLVELVKKYAAPMYTPTAGGALAAPAAPGQGEDDQHEAKGGDGIRQEVCRGGPMMCRDRHGRFGEHHIGDDRPAHASDDLCGHVRPGVAPSEPAEGGIDQGHDRVEMRPRHRAEHQDDGVEPGSGGGGVLEQLEPDVGRRQARGRRCPSRRRWPPGRRCRAVRRSAGGTARPASRPPRGAGSDVRGLSNKTAGPPGGWPRPGPACSSTVAQPSVERPRYDLLRGVGQDGVDLPWRTVGVGHPGLVLDGVAAGGRLLDDRSEGLAGQPACGCPDVVRRLDLHPQVVERAGHAEATPGGVLGGNEHQLERRLGDGEVGVAPGCRLAGSVPNSVE